MDKVNEHISSLISKYIAGTLSEEERAELTEWIDHDDNNGKTFRRITNLKYIENRIIRQRMVDYHRPMRDMKARISEMEATEAGSENAGRNPLRRILYSVAACALVLIIAGLWIGNNKSLPGITGKEDYSVGEQTASGIVTGIESITHGETKAQLTLDDGTVLLLGADNKKNEDIIRKASENKSLLSKLTKNNISLSIPRGGEFKVTLEDGTEVWLNAESQLVYPETFDENERRVQLKGEAYFKVAKNADKPFYVESEGQQIRVTGTEFNVNCYAEDKEIFTTLVTGNIALSPLNGEGGEVVVTPGHQVVFDKKLLKAQLRKVDTSVVTSWLKGSFVFENQTLSQIMRDLSRWYNFDYEFVTPSVANTVFMGTVPRYGDFHDVLTILEKSGNLNFKIEKNKLLIY